MFERLGLLSMGMAAAALLCACQPEAEETKPEAAAPAAPAAPEAAASAAAETPPASPGQATLPAECKIMNAFAWKASVNAMPPGPAKLGVSGWVVTNTGGYKLQLVRKVIDINSRLVTVDLVVTPPTDRAIQMVTTQQVTGSFVDLPSSTLDKVVVRCGRGDLATISPVPTNH